MKYLSIKLKTNKTISFDPPTWFSMPYNGLFLSLHCFQNKACHSGNLRTKPKRLKKKRKKTKLKKFVVGEMISKLDKSLPHLLHVIITF